MPAPGSPPEEVLHPFALFFHWAFKVAAWLFYFIGGWLVDGFVTRFVVTLVLLALDFWTVKNVVRRVHKHALFLCVQLNKRLALVVSPWIALLNLNGVQLTSSLSFVHLL